MKTREELDYEDQSTYTVELTASDGTETATISVTIEVVNKNEPPVFGTVASPMMSDTRSIREDIKADVNIGMPIVAVDPDITDTNSDANPETPSVESLTYGEGNDAVSGLDSSSFRIRSTFGQLYSHESLLASPPDYEGTKDTYEIMVKVSDGIAEDEILVTITVTDVNEKPVFGTLDTPITDNPVDRNMRTRTVAEGDRAGRLIGVPLPTEDPDDDMLTYDLSDLPGNDVAKLFNLNEMTGQLSTKASLDAETETSYMVMVTVSDGKGDTQSDGTTPTDTTPDAEITVTIEVTDVNEAPMFAEGLGPITRTVRENTRKM